MRKDCYWRIYSIDKLWCQLAKWYVSHDRDREQPLDAFIMLITIISHRFVIRFFTSEVYLQLPASHSLDLLWKCIIFWGLFFYGLSFELLKMYPVFQRRATMFVRTIIKTLLIYWKLMGLTTLSFTLSWKWARDSRGFLIEFVNLDHNCNCDVFRNAD